MTNRTREKLPERPSKSTSPLSGSTANIPPSANEDPPTSTSIQQLDNPRPNWFSPQPLKRSEESSTSTLSDLLARNPPPLASEPAFTPPVFLFIGPSNKGFNMLQRKGWQEGEGLGSGRIELKPRQGIGMNKTLNTSSTSDEKHVSSILEEAVKQETIDLTLSDSEQAMATPEVIDLTISDDDTETSDIEEDPEQGVDRNGDSSIMASSSHGTTLITPIATTLKADRLGIGLKAKRRGAAKAKAITHSSAAIASHIRTANQTRKEFKARFGRGSRGFARAKRKEEKDRVNMLAYLNS